MSSLPHAAAGLATAILFALSACSTSPDTPTKDRSRLNLAGMPLVEGEPLVTLLDFDAIPSIEDPTFVEAALADGFLAPDEPVLGVIGRNGTVHAYSAWQLDAHEIVNDVLDGEPIAATW